MDAREREKWLTSPCLSVGIQVDSLLRNAEWTDYSPESVLGMPTKMVTVAPVLSATFAERCSLVSWLHTHE